MFRSKIGFVFSGAGARIAQEFALTKALMEGLTPSGNQVRPDVTAGASAGSLNAVAVNAILKNRKQGKVSFGWRDYKKFLFELSNDKVFNTTIKGVRKIITTNIHEGFLLDTSPLRNFFEEVLERMGFDTLGSLCIPTYLSVVNHRTGEALRLSSRNPAHARLSLADILMASTAIPVVFPSVKIKGLAGEFIDGGTGRDGIPVEALASERCDEIFIISRMRGEYRRRQGFSLGKRRIEKVPRTIDNALFALELLMDSLFACEVDRAPLLAKRAFLYLPKLSTHFPMLDFSTQREQYEETLAWAKQHDPVRLKRPKRKRLLGLF